MEIEMRAESNRDYNRSDLQSVSNRDQIPDGNISSDQRDHHTHDRKKRGNFLLRQELRSYTPECNPTVGIIFNAIVTLIFLGLGFPMTILSEGMQEYQIDYTGW
jgi:hypothetical protein